MRQRDIAAMIADARMSSDASCLVLHYATRAGEGPHPYDLDSLVAVLGADGERAPGEKRIRSALACAEHAGYLQRSRGGRNTDAFRARFSPAQPAGETAVSPADSAGENLSPAQPAGQNLSPAQPAGEKKSATVLVGELQLQPFPPCSPPPSASPPPSDVDGRRTATAEMFELLQSRLADLPPPKQRGVSEEGRYLIEWGGSAWQDRDNQPIPWQRRPALLAGALMRVAAGDSPKLRAGLRYTIAQELDPHPLPSRPAIRPDTEAAAVYAAGPRSEHPGRGRRHHGAEQSSLTLLASIRGGGTDPAPNRQLAEWESQHPTAAEELRKAALSQARLDVPSASDTRHRAIANGLYGARVLDLLRRVAGASTDRRSAVGEHSTARGG